MNKTETENSKWLSIETVPKDGTEFQAWWNDEWVPRCRFSNGKFEEYGQIDHDREGWEPAWCGELSPTHWKPQPLPPQT